MFKKLKQKIEEGGEGGLERVSFAPNKLPGSVVRSTLQNEELVCPKLSETREPSTEPELHLESVKLDGQSGQLPNHITSQPHFKYQNILEARVRELEVECSHLSEKLSAGVNVHEAEQSHLEGRIVELDEQVTDLKLQIIEADLEKASKQQEHDKKCRELQEMLTKKEEQYCEAHTQWSNRLKLMRSDIEEKDRLIIEAENKYDELEKKAQHFESQLKAFQSSCENEVVNRLHHEVADVEQRVQSRNLEIQIMERRLAAQAREKEEQLEELLIRQEEIEKTNRELAEKAREEKIAKRELLKELENAQLKITSKDSDIKELKEHLYIQDESRQRLVVELEDLQRSHTEKIREMDLLVEEKERHIKELLHQLELSRGTMVLEPLSYPPGVARRTISIGVQVSLQDHEKEPAVLPSKEYFTDQVNSSSPANTASLGSEDALEVMKQQHSQMEEELAEKVKIIKIQQQKIMDIRKELRFQRSCNLPEESTHGQQKNHSPSPPRIAIASDVNFQYLKHVVIKFMCSREDEALQLIRAVSTLLEFSPQEEEHIKRYLNYKMSWFGVIPPPLFTSIK